MKEKILKQIVKRGDLFFSKVISNEEYLKEYLEQLKISPIGINRIFDKIQLIEENCIFIGRVVEQEKNDHIKKEEPNITDKKILNMLQKATERAETMEKKYFLLKKKYDCMCKAYDGMKNQLENKNNKK